MHNRVRVRSRERKRKKILKKDLVDLFEAPCCPVGEKEGLNTFKGGGRCWPKKKEEGGKGKRRRKGTGTNKITQVESLWVATG